MARQRTCKSHRQTAPGHPCVLARLRHGLSLIEAVIALGIISLLISMVLPAVERARESVRRLQCASNQRQLALASEQFHTVHRHLPDVSASWLGGDANQQPPGALSPWAQLLAFIDQPALARQLNVREAGDLAYPEKPVSRMNEELLEIRLSILECPSDSMVQGATSYRVCRGTMAGQGAHESANPRILGMHAGVYYSIFDAPRQRRPPTFAKVTDGLSNTILCSEKLVGDQDTPQFRPHRDTAYVQVPEFFTPEEVRVACRSAHLSDTSPHYSFGGSTWLLNGYSFTWYNHVHVPNSTTPDCTNAEARLAQSATTARSLHTGGVNAATADGAVRFISEDIHPSIWLALGSRAGGETVEW